MDTLFSIGHSQHSLDFFLHLLNSHAINYILDVRSTPYSQFASDYNKETIKLFLENNGISYAYMGNYFGARLADASLYTDGYLNFEKASHSLKFKEGFESVLKGVKQGYHIAFMCTEKDPLDCHRAIWISREFFKAGYSIKHILPDNSIQTQQELNQRLLDKYFPNRNQISLFSTENLSTEEYLAEAYKKQNEKIGYHMEEESL